MKIKLFRNTPSLEKRLLALEILNEDQQEYLHNNEAAKNKTKTTFDLQVNLRSFTEGYLLLAYDISHDTLVHVKFESLWRESYVIYHFLIKGPCILGHPEGDTIKDPVNGLYLKNFYPLA
jgi:hypothetical protein